jgi:ABC-type ATPase with predicted acetyltransferase domain
MTLLTINQKFRAAPAAEAAQPPGERVLKVAEMFGIGLDESYEVALYENFRIDIRPGDVVFITGPSGSGKSVLLGRIEEAMRTEPAARVVNLAGVEYRAAPSPVIALMTSPLDESLRLLSAAGLADAFLLLRTPEELSDGQRYRLRLARALEACGLFAAAVPGEPEASAPPLSVLVADEFCSTLDRLCARAVAYRMRRLADRYGLTVLAAAANDDLVEDLAPDVLVIKHEGSRVEVRYTDPARATDAPAQGERS